MRGATRWPKATLGECATLVNGRAYKQEELLDSGTPVLRIQNLNGGDRWYYSDLSLPQDKYCDKGDLLFAWSASFGPYLWNGPRAIYHYHIWKVLPGKSLDKGFLYHLLGFLTARVKSESHGASMLHMTKARMEALEIPLPPLEEQRRIAAILDKCHESELLATKATSLYSSLCKASFHSFLRQVEDRESIPHVPLSSVCTRITKGTTPSSLGLPDADGDIPFVRVQDIDKNVLIAESVALQIPMETHHALSRSMLQSGDILVSIAGTIGRVCEVRSLPPHGANCNQAVAIARPIPDVVRPLFLKCLLSDRPAQKLMRGAGVTGTITNLSLSQLGGIKIPVPSIEAQDRICDQLERLADIGERFQNSFVTAKRLSDSLTSFLMSGT